MKRTDIEILIIAILLSIIGLLMIYSAGGRDYFLRQLTWLVVAVIISVILSKSLIRFWMSISPILYIITVLLLILVLFLSPTYPKRWFNWGIISFQPSEFAKLGTILFLAWCLVNKKGKEKFMDFIILLTVALIPIALVFVEPDFGAAQIFLPVLVVMLFWAGMPLPKIFIFFSPIISAITSFSIYIWLGYMVILLFYLYFRKQLSELVYGLIANPVAGLITPVIWDSLKLYQQKRIISFLSPWIDPKGISWQIIQSKIAIGSGQLIGKGFLSGTQKRLEFLPERHTDFIFSCIGEEFGFIGITITILLYLFLFYKLLSLSWVAKNRFSSLVVIGFFIWFSYQTFINMGMTIGILPITGVPLPFISYGGSSLLAGFIAIGICLSISKSKYEY